MFHGSLKNIALPRAITISENVTEVKTSGCLKTFADFVKRRKQIFILLSSKKIDEKSILYGCKPFSPKRTPPDQGLPDQSQNLPITKEGNKVSQEQI
jgi:hypothetical protein